MNVLRILPIAILCASSPSLEAQHAIFLPKRLAIEPSIPALPPLPSDADQLIAVTMDVSVHGQPGNVLRTVDRILVITSQREWLFERNAVDRRRVSATVVEHAHKAVVVYEESDVRNLLRINGWAEVLASTSELTSPDRRVLKVGRVRTGVDEKLLRSAQARFPDYKLFEVADWLEVR